MEEKKQGRPSSYTKETGDKICQLIAEGYSLKKVCEMEDMPARRTVHNWLLDDSKKDFLHKYEQAVNIRTENMFDELEEIADDGRNDFMQRETEEGAVQAINNPENIQRSRLRIDTRKWYLSKVMPKKFGDKMDLTSDGKPLPSQIAVVYKEFGDEDNPE